MLANQRTVYKGSLTTRSADWAQHWLGRTTLHLSQKLPIPTFYIAHLINKKPFCEQIMQCLCIESRQFVGWTGGPVKQLGIPAGTTKPSIWQLYGTRVDFFITVYSRYVRISTSRRRLLHEGKLDPKFHACNPWSLISRQDFKNVIQTHIVCEIKWIPCV